MIITAKLRYLRIAPRKVRLVADLIRGKKVDEAQTILNFTTKKAAPILLKLLKQAIANAKYNFQVDESNLYISKILVDEGPKLKKWMPRARGQAYEIHKRTSHVSLFLNEVEKKPRSEEARIAQRAAKKVKKVEKVKEKEKEKKIEKIKKPPKFKKELEKPKPKIERGLQPTHRPPAKGGSLKRFFRRKAI